MEKYLKNCRHLFPIYGSYERKFLTKLKQQIQSYQETVPNASYDNIVDQFGTPTDVVISYYESINEDALLKRTNFARHIRNLLVLLLILVFSFLIYFSFITYQAYLDAKDTIILHEETIIYEE